MLANFSCCGLCTKHLVQLIICHVLPLLPHVLNWLPCPVKLLGWVLLQWELTVKETALPFFLVPGWGCPLQQIPHFYVAAPPFLLTGPDVLSIILRLVSHCQTLKASMGRRPLAAGSCEFQQLMESCLQASCKLADFLARHIIAVMQIGLSPASLALFILP